MKKSFLALAMAVILGIFLTQMAFAATWYPNCTLVSTGVMSADGSTFITATSSAWTGSRNFVIPVNPQTNTLLAVALTALSSSKTVSISANNTSVAALYLNQ